MCITDPKPEIFQSCGIAFTTPVIPKEFQSNSEIQANIFLRKSYPCGRKDKSNKLPFIFEPSLDCTMEWIADVVGNIKNPIQLTAIPVYEI